MATTNKVFRTALDAAVERFHARISADAELAGYFEGMDMRRILTQQIAMFTLLPAGPVEYAGAAK